MMPKHFKHKVIASTGDHDPKVNDKIKGWVEHAGGRFVKEVAKEVTHLICSKTAWKENLDMVKHARQLKSIHVVKLEWLENSLSFNKGKPYPEDGYFWEQRKITKNARPRQRRRKRDAEADSTNVKEEDDQKSGPCKRFKRQVDETNLDRAGTWLLSLQYQQLTFHRQGHRQDVKGVRAGYD
jgi:hypothetical protein